MKAVLIFQEEGKERPTLRYQEVDEPTPGPTELLVSVKAAGINRIDLLRSTAHGGPAAGKPLIAGLEMAGDVIAVGSEVTGFKVGDKVMGMTTGAYAEKAIIDCRVANPIPKGFGYDYAAAVTTVYPTAHNALVTNGRFTKGKTLLIQGAASAVGVATLQIAKAIGSELVIGTGRNRQKAADLEKYGINHFLVKGENNIAQRVLELTDGRGVDVVIDMVGGGALADNLASVALGGHIVSVGWMGGTKDELDLDTLARKRVSLVGVSFRTRTLQQKAELFSEFRRDIYPLFESGKLTPLIQTVYPLADALRAQEDIALDRHLGKMILHP
ncbi:zinc-binding dehydrogenase [Paraburkholderia sp. CNPSo 3076]|uniref:zinc-binding dehydrogenase n=1 Tax=Paraburkholderia sp. CNPSo 3076 TaxID=2940936 RepID=UPI002255370F|nr:zinc-binding dehydrogenase [Paraburkholderia sp. CNPSo 3076]MCX5542136.1 zinc-binding dehydrogenase [Paraburkholderia sp. CNPSo 3076]